MARSVDDSILEGFLEFDRRSAPTPKEPFVTLQKKGLMSLNRAAFDALGQPASVTLLYNPERRVIALRPTDPGNPRAYPVRRQGGRESGGGNYLVAGTAFTTFHRIATDVARRYTARLTDNVLFFDLNEDAPIVTGPRAKEGLSGRATLPFEEPQELA
jgi:hypothetical protein